MRAIIQHGRVVGYAEGAADGPCIPRALRSLALSVPSRLALLNGEIVDASAINDWFVGERGLKSAEAQSDDDQPIACAWDARLVLDNGTWRVETPADRLPAYLARRRWEIETGGIVVAGATIHTDRESQAMIAGAYLAVQRDPGRVIRFKAAGGWIDLDADAMTAIADAVAAHVQACFAVEADLAAKIAAGEITDEAGIDVADWPATAGGGDG